ncbi:amino acid permease [Kocuria tytonicola]|uniref:amino acid permease n=1 Tax=Kocuria tytonicola TaxID=2055946 RepID=UPI000EF8E32A|nr:amino acid permease [Kocuria tytonicola]RLZ04044.1 amino acid permease [Kocuria tytonicola]
MPFDPQAPATGPMPVYQERGDQGYKKSLGNFQIQMIGIGGAIGVGLFLGIGGRLAAAGPALIVSYLVVSTVVYLLMRALGELVIHRPTTGAWVSYAREFVGDRFAFMTGWIYVALSAVAGVGEIAALAVYVQFWWPEIPGWIPSLVAAMVIVGCNLLSVKLYGFIETWAAAIKVLAILLFLAAGIILVVAGDIFHAPTAASVSNLWNQGFAPQGVLVLVVVMTGVVFSFSAIEIVGVSAGEAKDPEKSMPKAINSVVLRIAIFYIGSILVLSMLLPTDQYSGEQSPFVTALSSLNIPALAGIMNFVVLTAAVSGVNATLYACVRLLRNLAAHRQAPEVMSKVSERGVPSGALVCIFGFDLLGIALIYVLGASDAFEVVLSACSVFVLFGWISIFVSHLGYRRQVSRGLLPGVHFKMPGAPVTNWVCLVFLSVLSLYIMFDLSNPHWYYSLLAGVLILVATNIGYEFSKRHVAKNGLPELTTTGEEDDVEEAPRTEAR